MGDWRSSCRRAFSGAFTEKRSGKELAILAEKENVGWISYERPRTATTRLALKKPYSNAQGRGKEMGEAAVVRRTSDILFGERPPYWFTISPSLRQWACGGDREEGSVRDTAGT